MEYTAIIRKTEDGWYAAKCAQIPEAITQGSSIEEARANLADAIDLVLQQKKEQTIREVKKQQPFYKYIFRKVAVL
ncbi:MAG: type II toxin-antitoxin system HicB family antitoxin [Bacteroidales bacterium]|jgi:predicted RNase H-like HicB family nuclease|nr:type II toxin-antitoxin system HicB family antitoxin [Bacteroidales bacterium]